ncbi:hypothetical protein ALC62_05069 [Cyphomyrmex costatus]|uniref:Uncharacterized protein n=1 Tax=Cyphomyrmex costatus TaxID=456900 RepID=A0A195CUE5_9HYME|nr:hypothetical protein ALC62_05069 [Cyphomyrmex costatus]
MCNLSGTRRSLSKVNGNDNARRRGAPTNEGNSSRVYVHSWLSATHTSSNKARLFIKRTNSILPKEVRSSGSKPSRKEVLDAKRARLRRLFKCDAIDLENSLRELGYAFIPTQP